MSPFEKSNNLAARMGRWSAGHRKTAIFGWLAFVVARPRRSACGRHEADQQRRHQHRPGPQGRPHPQAAPASTTPSGTTEYHPRPVEDAHGLRPGLPRGRPRRDRGRRGHAGGRSRALAATRRRNASADHEGRPRGLRRVRPRRRPDRRLQGRRHGPRGRRLGAEGQPRLLDPRDRRARARARRSTRMFNKQLAQAGELSLPLTLIILLVVFGALVAAGIPLLLAISAVLATLGLLALPSHLIPMDQSRLARSSCSSGSRSASTTRSSTSSASARSGRGRAHPRRRSRPPRPRRAGRCLISGFTVIIAMAGMFLSGDKTFMSFAVGDDDRRRRRDARLADRAAGAALAARRQGREGPHPVPSAGSAAATRAAGLEGRAEAGARASGVGGGRLGRRARRARDPRVQPPHLDQRDRRAAEERPRGARCSTTSSACTRAVRSPRSSP